MSKILFDEFPSQKQAVGRMFREETNASMKVHGSEARDAFIMLRLALGTMYPHLKANPPPPQGNANVTGSW